MHSPIRVLVARAKSAGLGNQPMSLRAGSGEQPIHRASGSNGCPEFKHGTNPASRTITPVLGSSGNVSVPKKLDRGRFIWPQAKDGVVSLTMAQLSMLLEIDPPARDGLDGEAGSCCLNAEFCAAVATLSGTYPPNRIGSCDVGSAVA